MTDGMPPQQLGDPATWGPQRRREVVWHDPVPTAAVGMQMSGLEYLRAMADGKLPTSPIAKLMNIEGVSASDGEVLFRCTPDESTYNPLGLVHGGLVCTLLDSVAGCAVHTTLPAGVGYTSIEIKVSYMRPVSAGTTLTARGWVTKRGRRVSFADAEAVDEDGRKVATAASSCLILGG
jgi:uncharacterized protein (TIGR00369 family)